MGVCFLSSLFPSPLSSPLLLFFLLPFPFLTVPFSVAATDDQTPLSLLHLSLLLPLLPSKRKKHPFFRPTFLPIIPILPLQVCYCYYYCCYCFFSYHPLFTNTISPSPSPPPSTQQQATKAFSPTLITTPTTSPPLSVILFVCTFVRKEQKLTAFSVLFRTLISTR